MMKKEDILKLYNKCECDVFYNEDYKPIIFRSPKGNDDLNKKNNCESFFLNYMGHIEPLNFEQADYLLKEIHWCLYKIRNSKKNINKFIKQIKEAEEELILGNRFLIQKELSKSRTLGYHVDDVRQEALTALVKAIRSYNINNPTPFFYYAKVIIKNKILNYIRSLKKSGDIYTYVSDLEAEIRNFKKENKNVTSNFISEKFKISLKEAKKINNRIDENVYIKSFSSLNQKNIITGEEFLESIPDEKYNVIKIIEHSNIIDECKRKVLSKLTSREKNVFDLIYIKNFTAKDVSCSIGLTTSRVHQIEKNIVKKVKEALLY